MSRHSKWAKIKRQKNVTDVKRGQLFSKLSRAITAAAREGSGDPDTNPRLRLAADRALAANMPKDNVTRAIERAAGADSASAATFTLEGYGPGGGALLIDVVTDNRNRTVSEVRHLLDRAGGSLGESGSVAWQFERRGLVVVENASQPERVELAAIDAGAIDIEREKNTLDISTPPENMQDISRAVERAGAQPASVQLTMMPKQWVTLAPDRMEKLGDLLAELEAHDDVIEVTTNATPPESDEAS
ncbi:MAG: Transcriptional regulator [Parcubacteria group bacterium Gr01-1014_106]|nr:MAG: Transcriptional regulator [Parcubacteria group bacterium Gr01-1014_106]